jgi:hypothetical protein
VTNTSPITLDQLFRNNKNLPHQLAAVAELEQDIRVNDYDVAMRRNRPWFKTWSQAGKQLSPLPVPYQSQRDNYRDANRTCFSSSCAMLLMTLKPGAIHSDDDYIKTIFSIGDTTDASVQLKALAKYGIKARFETGGNRDLIKRQIDAGKPVPAGFLHHGLVTAPSGGGHWLCIIGYDDKGYWVNDPWGEMNLTAGTYGSTVGSKLHYSYANWEPRWMVDGPSTGWCIIA